MLTWKRINGQVFIWGKTFDTIEMCEPLIWCMQLDGVERSNFGSRKQSVLY